MRSEVHNLAVDFGDDLQLAATRRQSWRVFAAVVTVTLLALIGMASSTWHFIGWLRTQVMFA